MKRPTIRMELAEAVYSVPGAFVYQFAERVADAILKSRKFVVRRRAVGRKG